MKTLTNLHLLQFAMNSLSHRLITFFLAYFCLYFQASAMPYFYYMESHPHDSLYYFIDGDKAYVTGRSNSNLKKVTIPEHVNFEYYVEKGGVIFLPSPIQYDTIKVDADVVAIYDEAFKGTDITFLTIKGNVEIGEKAFQSCAQLKNVSFSGGVTEIGDYAFSGCSSLTNVSISRGLKSIGYGAFLDCTELSQVNLPSYYDLETIGGEAFKNCTKLKDFSFNQKLTTIGSSAFESCTALTSLTIDKNIRTIGKEAFKKCTGLKTVELFNTDSLFIDEGAFYQCKNIEKLFCQNLGNWCLISFGSAEANPIFYTHRLRYPPSALHAQGEIVKRIKIPEGIKEISSYAFFRLDDMTRIDLPSSLEKIGANAFNSSVADIDVVRVRFRNAFEIKYSTFHARAYRDALLIVPNVAGCKEAFSATTAWAYFNNIIATGHYDFTFDKIVEFEDPLVESLCLQMWDTNQDGLLSYGEIHDVKDIGKTFYQKDITSFNELQYFSGLTFIPQYAFSNCRRLRSIVLPDEVQKIRDNSFTGATSLEAFHIPAEVDSIGGSILAGATSIKRLTIDPDNTHFMLQEDILYQGSAEELIYCPPHKSGPVTLPNSVIRIDDNAFYLCEKITDIHMNEGLKYISDAVFMGCNGLATLLIPASVEKIGTGCFYCPNMKAIYVAEGSGHYLSVDDVLYSKDGELIYYPPAKEGKEYVVIDGTSDIAPYACCASHLERVILPATTQYVGAYAFGLCSELRTVNCHAVVPPNLEADGFKGLDSKAELYVPAESVEAYRESEWGIFFPKPLPDGIKEVNAGLSSFPDCYYRLDGSLTSAPQNGVNIVRRADGSTKKLLIRDSFIRR